MRLSERNADDMESSQFVCVVLSFKRGLRHD